MKVEKDSHFQLSVFSFQLNKVNWLDLLIVGIVSIGLIKGLFDGLIKQVVSLVSLILAVFFAGRTAKPLCDYLVNQEFLTNIISTQIIAAICYILAFTLIILVFGFLGKILNKTIKVTPVSCLNYMLGGLLGAFTLLLLLSLIFNVLTAIDSDSKIIKEQTKKESVLFDKVEKIVPFISPFIKDAHKIKENLPIPTQEKENEIIEHIV